ncbi:hypothetical protein SAMN05443428_11050 [Caloramator quimbayensis]|uniref:Uncharacterized protein n=1 Tax=Caloramator quimbayensis TaxID=1147123 RepID=A0A1T4XLC7_9CLOT|nr:hypothetical protein [Caloramator quimbayensis]SKA90193.1 hypothetical protein SAMN05443428_11050 [Caloramator quimbayensis]
MKENEVHQFLKLISSLNINPYAENLRLRQNDERIKILNVLKDFLPDDKQIIIDDIIKTFSTIDEEDNSKINDDIETLHQDGNLES